MALTVEWLQERLKEFPPDMPIKAVYRMWSDRHAEIPTDGDILDVGTVALQPTWGENVCVINVGLPE